MGNETRRTFLGKGGELADRLDLLLALGRPEELDLALEHVFLLHRETGVVRNALVVLMAGRLRSSAGNTLRDV